MGFMDFAKSVGGAALDKLKTAQAAEDEGYSMDAEELASALNHASGDRRVGLLNAARNRGDIGHSNGRFYVK